MASGVIPGTEGAVDYDELEIIYSMDVRGQPMQSICTISTKVSESGACLTASDTSADGRTMQIARRCLGFVENGSLQLLAETCVNFGEAGGTVKFQWAAEGEQHIRVHRVTGIMLPA